METISEHLNIVLIKVSKKSILSTVITISDRKNIKEEAINLTLENKAMCYCDKLPFEIISFNRYINIETVNIISSYDKDEEYYVSLAIKLWKQNTF